MRAAWLALTWSLAALACEGRSGARDQPSSPPPAQTSTASPVSRPPEPARSSSEPASSATPPAPGYLVLLQGWKLAESPELAREIPAVSSVELAPGFPRAANDEERRSLRSGYGALLAGVCPDAASAERALAALRTEHADAYVKRAVQASPAACPVPLESWKHHLALRGAVERGDVAQARRAFRDGAAAFGARGELLDIAAYQADLDMARLLLEHGASPNRPRAAQEESALELALRAPSPSLELVKLLLQRGADANARTEGAEADPGSSPLRSAVRYCNADALRLLLAHGARAEPAAAEEICQHRPGPDRASIEALLRDGASR